MADFDGIYKAFQALALFIKLPLESLLGTIFPDFPIIKSVLPRGLTIYN